MKAALMHKYDTVYNADSVEWCPIPSYQSLFACGNYQLADDKSNGMNDVSRSRFGRVLLFEYTKELHLLQSIETAAVLDQKWCHNLLNGKPVLAVTTAQAALDLYTLDNSKLTSWLTYRWSDERLILSVDWSTGKDASEQPNIVVSDNLGNLHLLVLFATGIQLLKSWQLHSHEAWICAFDYWHSNCIFSGADDTVFIKTDTKALQHVRNKSHQCGVTSMHSNAKREYCFATGSYDTFVRIWDTRMLRAPQEELQMNGPVWRVKWDPFTHDYLLTACMDGGVSIIEATERAAAKITVNFTEHESIVYGADWCHISDSKLFASCSFYDHLLIIASY